MLLFLVVAFVGSMQTFLNVAVWVTLSEIFPLRMRAFGMGASVFMLWITNAFLGLYFPTLISAVGITGSFFLFAALGQELESDVMSGELFARDKLRSA